MTRARFVMGSEAMRSRFNEVRRAVISAPREDSSLRDEIVTMRNRVRTAHTIKPKLFDVKHSPGGMVDAEFAVQYLVLMHAGAHPEMADNVGNIALLQRAEDAGLLPHSLGVRASAAYRELRRVQHKARLNEAPTQVPQAELQKEREAILALWHWVFPETEQKPLVRDK